MMNIVHDFSDLKLNKSCVTIGAFDGVHLGHRRLLQNAFLYAGFWSLPTVVITFDPIPSVFFRPSEVAANLMLPDEKADLIESLDFDNLLVLPFTEKLANCSAQDFLAQMKSHFNPKALWIGTDFSLGNGREGNAEYLDSVAKDFGFSLHIVPKLEMEGGVVSSSRIRGLLFDGEVSQANRLLGYSYGFESLIIHGDGRGKTLGYPTINMQFQQGKLVPAYGVYACWLTIEGKRYPAVTNVGVRPTFKDDNKVLVESYLLEGGFDVYGEKADIRFESFIRAEQKFPDAESLKYAVAKDCETARSRLLLSHNKN